MCLEDGKLYKVMHKQEHKHCNIYALKFPGSLDTAIDNQSQGEKSLYKGDLKNIRYKEINYPFQLLILFFFLTWIMFKQIKK